MLAEFERISERGGVLGAMETGYQRGRIQDESMLYEQRKHDGIAADHRREHVPRPGRREREPARRSSWPAPPRTEKQSPARPGSRDFQTRARDEAAGRAAPAAQAALAGENVFAVLMDAVRVVPLGQITDAFFEVGGQYRRNV